MRLGFVFLLALCGTAYARPPAHLAAWDKEWREYRRCQFGDPQLHADLDVAQSLNTLAYPVDCDPIALRLKQIVHDADSDPGYHYAWLKVRRAVEVLVDAKFAETAEASASVNEADDALHDFARVRRTQRAIEPMIEIALPPPIARTLGEITEISEVRDHLISARILRNDKRVRIALATKARDPYGDWDVADDDAGVFTRDVDGFRVATVMGGRSLSAISQHGTGDERAVSVMRYRGEQVLEVFVVRSRDRGRTWGAPVSIAKNVDVFVLPNGAAVLRRDTGTTHTMQTIDPSGVVSKVRTFHGGEVLPTCAVGSTLWWLGARGDLHVVDDQGERSIVAAPAESIVACNAAVAVIGSKDVNQRCDRNACAAPIYPEPHFVDIDDRDRVVTAMQTGDAIVVARGDDHRVLHCKDARLIGVVVWNDVPQLVFQRQSYGGISIVPVAL